MFCYRCGSQTADGALACPQCGATLQAGANAGAVAASSVTAASRDAVQALRTFVLDPVGGLRSAYENLEPNRSALVGLLFGAVFVITFAIGVTAAIDRTLGFIGGFMAEAMFGSSRGVGPTKTLIFGVFIFASIAAASALTRVIFRGGGDLTGDLFIAGASVLPIGLVTLIASFLGISNLEITLLLVLFAICYTILILYSGCTQISHISARGAAFAVPVMIALSAWLSKIVFFAAVMR